MEPIVSKEVPKDFELQIKKWHSGALTLHSIYITLGLITVISSIIVATFTQDIGTFWTKVLASTSAISATLIETTGVGKKGNGFRKAHRHLKVASIRFREGEYSMKELTTAFEEAESMIGDVEIKINNQPSQDQL